MQYYLLDEFGFNHLDEMESIKYRNIVYSLEEKISIDELFINKILQ
jgi:hypothetical protein